MLQGDEFIGAVKNYRNDFHSVVPYLPNKDTLLHMDFTASNGELNDEILKDTYLFSQYIKNKLETAGATYGVGGYNEHRTIYSRSAVFDAVEEPRRWHLGLDIWGHEGTPVHAPLEGVVHSFAFNNAFGDYGATLILEHQVAGILFHTLYGHLSLHSIEDKREGQTVEKGEWIASFGKPEENGQWPPHLHFQIILDMGGGKGDYPGVCSLSDRDAYLLNCPDPYFLSGLYP